MGSIIRCRACGLPLSESLEADQDVSSTGYGEPYVRRGQLLISDGTEFNGTAGRYVINLADARNLQLHPDRRRRNGGCGLDGLDGPNRTCACGAEVATEKSDCWMPHALIFETDAVRLAESDPPA